MPIITLRRPKNNDAAVDLYADVPINPSTTYIGVELDNTQCRSVSIRNGEVLAWETFRGDTPQEALAAWAKHTRTSNAQVRICWSGPGQRIKTIRVQSIPNHIELQKALIQDLAAEYFPDASGVSGKIYPPDGHPDGQLVVMVGLARNTLDHVWTVIADHQWQVVPSVLLTTIDGIHLFVQESVSRVVGVQNQQILASNELSAGGIDTLVDKLQVSSSSELPDDIHAQDPRVAVVQGYLSQIIGETNRWVESWISNSTIDAPDRLWIHGPGARMPNLANELLSTMHLSGYYAHPEQVFPQLNVSNRTLIPDLEIPAAWMPVLAGVSSISDTMVLDNPVAIRMQLREKARRQHFINISIIALAIIMLAALLVAPWLTGDLAERSAASNLAAAQQTKTHLKTQYEEFNIVTQGREQLQQIAAHTPDYAKLWTLVDKTIPPGGIISSMAIVSKGATVAATMQVTITGSQQEVGQWLDNLTAEGFTNANTVSFSQTAKGMISSSYTFNYSAPSATNIIPVTPPTTKKTTPVTPPSSTAKKATSNPFPAAKKKN